MFADSFSVLSIHLVAGGLGARFLTTYKYSASCGGSLRQHGLLVFSRPRGARLAKIKPVKATMSTLYIYTTWQLH